MYYLEDLTLQDIRFLKELLEDYKTTNTKTSEDGKPPALPVAYHSIKAKVKRLVKYVSYNPNETDTPKKPSKYSVFKKQLREDNNLIKLNKKTYRIKKWNKYETAKAT
jgi:hypothetical protein